MEAFKKILLGTSGILGVHITPALAEITSNTTNEIISPNMIQLIIQTVIGIVTIIQLLKKNKQDKKNA